MAITKLMHMKESKGRNPSSHLYNAIDYILDPEKTKGGLLVGGNCGCTTDVVYNTMMDTKLLYGKNWGRQGYHYVLSFPPDEVTAEKARDLTEEFCQKYFKEEYEYVLAAHDDHDHKHGHIVFNSVSREGRKYRYERGDWSKFIQKLANEICKEHGLSYIKLEKNPEERVKDHKKWETEAGVRNWSNLIRQNIDEAIEMSVDYDGFIKLMEYSGYKIKKGVVKAFGEYLSFKPEGAGSARRSYRLGRGYSVKDIQERIEHKEMDWEILQKVEDMGPRIHTLQTKYRRVSRLPLPNYYYKKCYFLCTWNNRIRSPYKAIKPWKYRQDLRELNQHMESLEYSTKQGIHTLDDAKYRKDYLEKELETLKFEQKKLYREGDAGEGEEKKKKISDAIRKNRTEQRVLERIVSTYHIEEKIPELLTEEPEKERSMKHEQSTRTRQSIDKDKK
ncbi:MAG: relaxase/mobilization nuclease domain-containing protein [Ruminococcus sp.]|nr:relaxase/mobilization nuclease domain-containing protein [Ruminococcus sp.]